MKRILCCLLVLVLIFGCTACKPKHEHTLGEWTIVDYATCGADGSQTAVCSECDETVTEVIPATGDHKYSPQYPTMCDRCFKVNVDDTETLIDLGNAASSTYSIGMAANCAWDLQLWDGKLYRGAGNYDTNSGRTLIWYYDIANKQWVPTDTVDDESISRFSVVGDTLMAPGIDPTEEWDLGNYYILKDGSWEKVRKLPGGIHTFALQEFDGKVFFGLGCNAGDYPVYYTTDHENYVPVPLYKNGEPCDTTNDTLLRSYELFVFKDALYTIIRRNFSDGTGTLEFYRYEDDKMVYVSDVPFGTSRTTYNFVDNISVYGDTLYFSSYYLYSTQDMINFKKVPLPNDAFANDMIVDGKKAYVLSYTVDEEETYTVYLYRYNGENFELLYSFDYDVPAHAFEKDGDTYYLAMGSNTSTPSIHTGTVLRLTL